MSTKRTAFSLTTLLLVTALIALLVSNYSLRKEKEALHIANKNMANELLTQFEVSEPGKIHWSEIQLPSKMMWRFRVYIPPGKSMLLKYSVGRFEEEFPDPMRSFEEIIEGSEQLQTITIQIRQRDAKNTKVDAFVNGAFAHGVGAGTGPHFSWLDQLEELSGILPSSKSLESWPKISSAEKNLTLLEKSEVELDQHLLGGVVRDPSKPPYRFKPVE